MSRNRPHDAILNEIDWAIRCARDEMDNHHAHYSRDCGSYYSAQGQAIGDAMDNAEAWRSKAAAEYDGQGHDAPEVITAETLAELLKAEAALDAVMAQG